MENAKHSAWKVTSNFIAGKILYAVFRIKDTSQILHSGNMEYATGYMESKEDAQKIADKLNGAN